MSASTVSEIKTGNEELLVIKKSCSLFHFQCFKSHLAKELNSIGLQKHICLFQLQLQHVFYM